MKPMGMSKHRTMGKASKESNFAVTSANKYELMLTQEEWERKM